MKKGAGLPAPETKGVKQILFLLTDGIGFVDELDGAVLRIGSARERVVFRTCLFDRLQAVDHIRDIASEHGRQLADAIRIKLHHAVHQIIGAAGQLLRSVIQ